MHCAISAFFLFIFFKQLHGTDYQTRLSSTDEICLDLSWCACFDKVISDIIFHVARIRLADGSLPVLLPELVLLHASHLGYDRRGQWVLSARHRCPPRMNGEVVSCQAVRPFCALATCPLSWPALWGVYSERAPSSS